jgi:hypothetical protein
MIRHVSVALALVIVLAGCNEDSDKSAQSDDTSSDPVLTAAKASCEAGDSYGNAQMMFLEDGTGPDTVAALNPIRGALGNLKSALASQSERPGAADLRAAIDQYERGFQGYAVLYGQGETAYQSIKNAGGNVDELRTTAEAAWLTGATAMFGEQAPSAPSLFERTC